MKKPKGKQDGKTGGWNGGLFEPDLFLACMVFKYMGYPPFFV